MQDITTTHKRWLGVAATAVVLTGVSTAGLLWKDTAQSGVAHARPFTNESGQSIADVTERALPSVVSITTRVVQNASMGRSRFGGINPSTPFERPFRREGRGVGSGVIVSAKGYVLTNNHVVSGAKGITVKLHNGRELAAKLVGTDPQTDLAVLKLKGRIGKLKPLKFGNSSRLRLGAVVLAIGNPLGVGKSVSMGIVSAKGRSNLQLGVRDGYQDFIQTDAAINPGNSGGALINMNGELVGINTAILSRSGGYQGIGFAIPSDMARPIMKSLIRSGKVSRGYLGVLGQTLDEDLAQALKIKAANGALVTNVEGNSPASRAGLRRNDLINRVNGRPVSSWREFRNTIASAGAGTVVTLQVERKGQLMPLPVTLGDLARDARLAQKRGSRGAQIPGTNNKAFGVRLAALDQRSRRRFNIPSRMSSGVVVVDVRDGSLATRLGIQAGDVIMEINGLRVGSPAAFKKAYQRSGRKLALLTYQDGATRYIAVTK